jgi:UDPglucose 6-dehydrogenase
MSVSVIGLGFVGGAMLKSFNIKNVKNVNGYDKYKNGGIGSLEECLKSDILFLALPTQFSYSKNQYDKSAINEVCVQLENSKYSGCIVIKSTVEPGTTKKLSDKFKLNFVHNPEFLTAVTAFEDFHNQKHIVLGRSESCSDKNYMNLKKFYVKTYPEAEVSECTCTESESMKSFVNCFYASKVQIFNEFYLLCQKNGSNYNKIKDLMLKNGWINPMHTQVPGPDGQLSYGGYCFPKDTNALHQYMKELDSERTVLKAVIDERNEMRKDEVNCIKNTEKKKSV